MLKQKVWPIGRGSLHVGRGNLHVKEGKKSKIEIIIHSLMQLSSSNEKIISNLQSHYSIHEIENYSQNKKPSWNHERNDIV